MPVFKVQIHHDEDSFDDAFFADVEADTADEAVALARQRWQGEHYSIVAWSAAEWQQLRS